ncbi:MAG: putative membrane protein YfcA [Parasphingorhabdus sp.]|jgi:uncharacterized membrane protein YfcA
MPSLILSDTNLLIVLIGACFAGFTTGFAGFGTGLIASGFWFHALPAGMVPPLVAITSVSAQIIGLIAVRKSFNIKHVSPLLMGAVLGVPLGVFILTLATPLIIKIVIGSFLLLYSVSQLFNPNRWLLRIQPSAVQNSAVGAVGGFLGGFAGLSGPVPLIWLQLQSLPSDQQRAIYQPFNLIVLSLAVFIMAIGGKIDLQLLQLFFLCLPLTLFFAWLGTKLYSKISEDLFRTLILLLLFCSGLILVLQTIFSGIQ